MDRRGFFTSNLLTNQIRARDNTALTEKKIPSKLLGSMCQKVAPTTLGASPHPLPTEGAK